MADERTKDEIRRRAREAVALEDNPDFTAICAEMHERACQLFLASNCDIEAMARAHSYAQAVTLFLGVIQSRKGDASHLELQEKRQHRGND